jgi:two-component system, LuxR family, sensor histidine kinase DctS
VPGASPRLLNLLLDMEVHGVLTADTHGRVTYGNPAACALLGFNMMELQTMVHVTDVYYRPDDARRVMRAARQEDAVGVDVMLRTRSGELVPACVHARLQLDDTGTFVGTVGILEDRRELVDLHRRLEEAASQVIASERRVAARDTTAEAANEISQPLMAAMGNIELALLEPLLDARVSSRLERAYEQLERLKTLAAEFARRGAPRTSG